MAPWDDPLWTGPQMPYVNSENVVTVSEAPPWDQTVILQIHTENNFQLAWHRVMTVDISETQALLSATCLADPVRHGSGKIPGPRDHVSEEQ